MISKLAVWYLRKRKKSTIIGYKFERGKMQPLQDVAFIYDNELSDVDYRWIDGTPFNIPEGKFCRVKREIK